MSFLDDIFRGTMANNVLGVVPTSSEEQEVAQQIAQLPAIERQIDALFNGAKRYDTPGTPPEIQAQIVDVYNQTSEAYRLLRELDAMAREALTAAIEAGDVNPAEVPELNQEGLGVYAILAVGGRVALAIARFFTSSKFAMWAAKWVNLTAIIAALQIAVMAITNLFRTGSASIEQASNALALPLLVIAGLWIASQFAKRKRGG